MEGLGREILHLGSNLSSHNLIEDHYTLNKRLLINNNSYNLI